MTVGGSRAAPPADASDEGSWQPAGPRRARPATAGAGLRPHVRRAAQRLLRSCDRAVLLGGQVIMTVSASRAILTLEAKCMLRNWGSIREDSPASFMNARDELRIRLSTGSLVSFRLATAGLGPELCEPCIMHH